MAISIGKRLSALIEDAVGAVIERNGWCWGRSCKKLAS
jgi:hypothetical protein